MQPSNEMETVILLATMQKEYGIQIKSAQRPFPDMLIDINGNPFSVEIEYKASNFIKHKHDPRKCDLIICWIDDIENDTGQQDFPLPIIQLANHPIKETFCELVKADSRDIEIWYLTRRVETLEREKATVWDSWTNHHSQELEHSRLINDLIKGDPSDPNYILVLHDTLKMELEMGDSFNAEDAIEIWSEYKYTGQAAHLHQMVQAGYLKVQGGRFKLVDKKQMNPRPVPKT